MDVIKYIIFRNVKNNIFKKYIKNMFKEIGVKMQCRETSTIYVPNFTPVEHVGLSKNV
jgi:hypothetical protein